MTEESNSNKGITTSFNILTTIVCVLYLIRHIIHVITEGIKLTYPENFIYNGVKITIANHDMTIYNIVTSILFIVIMANILRKKKWAVISFFAFQLINAISIYAILKDFNDFGIHLAISIIYCIILFLLLQLRNNGIKGWNIIFNNQKHSNKAIYKIIKEHILSKEIKEKISETKSEQESKEKAFSKKKILVTLFSSIFIIALIVLCISYNIGNSPQKLYEKADTLFVHGKIEDALDIYKQLAEKENYAPAKTKLGILYLTNDSVTIDSVAGFKYLEETAITDSLALEKLIYLYGGQESKGANHYNSQKLEQYTQLAFDQNRCLGAANIVLGMKCTKQEKYNLAYYYFTEATKYREPCANLGIGWLYLNGYGCEEDYYKAKEYLERELKINENSQAYYFLGMMYKEGAGVKKSMQNSIKYLQKAAKLGDENAKEKLAKIEMDKTDNKKNILNLWEEQE